MPGDSLTVTYLSDSECLTASLFWRSQASLGEVGTYTGFNTRNSDSMRAE